MSWATSRSNNPKIAIYVVLALAGLLAYCNTFTAPFVFDDIDALRGNPQIHSVFPSQSGVAPSTLSGRPLLRLSFVLNYFVSRENVWSYHLLNLIIHIAAGLLVFEIFRAAFWRSRYQEPPTPRREKLAWIQREDVVAGIVAALWLVHPLNTEAVTYLVQRGESLAGLMLLLAVYALIRTAQSSGRTIWPAICTAACLGGTLSKEYVAAGPIILLLMDRAFFSGSLWRALKRHPWMYLTTLLCWIPVAISIAHGDRAQSAGFSVGVSPTAYAMTQLNVVADYVRLAFAPVGQCFDYGRTTIASWRQVTNGGWVIGILLGLTIVGTIINSPSAIAGVWFFLILGPSSSFLPIWTEIQAEHRMYLPLVAVIGLCVVSLAKLFRESRFDLRPALEMLGLCAAVLLVLVSIILTLQRNALYQSGIDLWRDTVAKAPKNPRAHFNLGYEIMQRAGGDKQQLLQASLEFEKAVELQGDYAMAALYTERCMVLAGENSQAAEWADKELAAFAKAPAEFRAQLLRDRASALLAIDQINAAIENLRTSIALQENSADGHYLLAMALLREGNESQARQELTRTLQLAPEFEPAKMKLNELQAGGNVGK